MQRISDAQWERIRDYLPKENIPERRRGSKPVPARQRRDAVLRILSSGTRRHMLAQCYSNCKTVHRRFQQWAERDVLRGILTQLANALRTPGEIDERDCFIAVTFASATVAVGDKA
jgi:transposase